MEATAEAHALRVQLVVSQLLIAPTYLAVWLWMRFVRRYRFEELAGIRAKYREILASGDGPIIVCANHLTLIDSFLLIWALASPGECVLRSSRFPWNLPEKRNFYRQLALRALCYAGKCIPVLRQGPREEQRRLLDKVSYLTGIGETIMLFPEGGRSRTGRIDTENFAYGVGTMVQEAPAGTRVVCAYLRGEKQKTYSDFPARGDRFRMDLRLIRPTSANTGLRGARDIATQIVRTLVTMEEKHFATANSRGDAR